MFERYTERARRVLFFARYEASQLGSISIETEHLLLGLLREDLVANPSDRVFVGDANRVTLRIPAPTGTTEATGDATGRALPVAYAVRGRSLATGGNASASTSSMVETR